MSETEYKSVDSIRVKTEWEKKKSVEAAIYPMNVLNPYNSATGKLEKQKIRFLFTGMRHRG